MMFSVAPRLAGLDAPERLAALFVAHSLTRAAADIQPAFVIRGR